MRFKQTVVVFAVAIVLLAAKVKGVEQEAINSSDMVIEIPQYGTKHSLNISVSAGLVVWELFKKFKDDFPWMTC